MAKNEKVTHAIIIEDSNFEKALENISYFFKILLCKSKISEKPCNACSSCIKIEKNCHPDIKFFSLEKDSKSIKIESIRFIRKDSYIIPNEGKYKIYVLSPAETLTVQAQNAFIKLLEEPPKNVIFILLCKSVEPLLNTVISRCQIFRSHEEGIENEDEKAVEYANEITKLSVESKRVEIIKILAGIAPNRIFLKKFMVNMISDFIQIIKNSSDIEFIKIVSKKIDDIKYAINLIEKNVNVGLILTYLSIVL